jgi:hypothetical protein
MRQTYTAAGQSNTAVPISVQTRQKGAARRGIDIPVAAGAALSNQQLVSWLLSCYSCTTQICHHNSSVRTNSTA